MSFKAVSSVTQGYIYCCAPDVVWVRDAGRLLLVDAKSGQSWSLLGLEAAIWDWLALGYSYGRIVLFVSLILQASLGETAEVLDTVLRRWQAAGIVLLAGGV